MTKYKKADGSYVGHYEPIDDKGNVLANTSGAGRIIMYFLFIIVIAGGGGGGENYKWSTLHCSFSSLGPLYM